MSNIRKKKFKILEDEDEDKINTSNEIINEQKLIILNNKDNNLLNKYVNSLDEIEIHAMNIAKKMLESSFDIEKSIGFLEFKKEK